MSIKGSGKELYVGKQTANIITSWGNKIKIDYSELKRVDYIYSSWGKPGYLGFVKQENTISFKFNQKSNEKIAKTIRLIRENNPELKVFEINKNPSSVRPVIVLAPVVLCFILGSAFFVTSYSKKSVVSSSIPDPIMESTTIESVNNEPAQAEAFSTTLIAGHYLVGTDIPVGTYNFYSKNGSGNLYSSDGTVNVIFDHNNESGGNIGLVNFGTEELKNIYLEKDMIITVTGNQEISAGCDDGLVDSMQERNQEGLIELEIAYGNFGASDNVPAGTYDVEWVEGTGNIICSSNTDSGINEIMGESSDTELDKMHIKKFRNLTLSEGDILEIDKIKVKLIPSK